jgi:hypothetical protein
MWRYGVNYTRLYQDNNLWQALVDTVLNFRSHRRRKRFLTSWTTLPLLSFKDGVSSVDAPCSQAIGFALESFVELISLL